MYINDPLKCRKHSECSETVKIRCNKVIFHSKMNTDENIHSSVNILRIRAYIFFKLGQSDIFNHIGVVYYQIHNESFK